MDIEGLTVGSLDFEWRAIYNDGTKLDQHYGVGEEKGEHHFGHIDQDKLSVFWLIDSATGEKLFGVDVHEQTILVGDVPFIVEFPRTNAGEPVKGKLVYFRRVSNDFAPEGITTTVRYAIGLQANIDGRNHQQYLFINMDGTFTLSQQK